MDDKPHITQTADGIGITQIAGDNNAPITVNVFQSPHPEKKSSRSNNIAAFVCMIVLGVFTITAHFAGESIRKQNDDLKKQLTKQNGLAAQSEQIKKSIDNLFIPSPGMASTPSGLTGTITIDSLFNGACEYDDKNGTFILVPPILKKS